MINASRDAFHELRINNFDLIRLLAATQVAVFHSVEHLEIESIRSSLLWPIISAFPGVPVFFVVSGFLISMSYERTASATEYFRNRALRIFPALWVCLVVSAFSVLVWGIESLPETRILDWLVWWAAQMSTVQFYNPDFRRGYGSGVLNGSLWTIPVELQFYLILPIGYAIFRLRERRKNIVLIVVTLVGVGFHTWFNGWTATGIESLLQKLLSVSIAPYLYMFLLGVLAQRNILRMQSLFFGKAVPWLLVAACTTVVCSSAGLVVVGNNLNPISMLVLAGVTISSAYTSPAVGSSLLHENDISYGVYIYHMPIINVLIERGYVGHPSWLAVTLVSTGAFAALSWWLVERRFLRRKRSSLRSSR